MARRGVNQLGVLQCAGCESSPETTTHLFFECKIFSSLWMKCLGWFGISSALTNICKNHLYQFSGLINGNKQQIKSWQLVWLSLIWSIWLARNQAIFNAASIDLQDILDLIKIRSWLWLKNKLPGFSYPFASWSSNPRDCLLS